MSAHLLIAVYLHADGMGTARYHGFAQGSPEWPPAPARVFQALVAGVARGRVLPEAMVPVLQWLECQPPPVIAAPFRVMGGAVSIYVPNNDADSLPDPSDVSSIRAAKRVQPSLFDAASPLMYAWSFRSGSAPLPDLIEATHALYQLGRGVDMAWADARVVTDDELHALLQSYRGTVHRPSSGASAPPVLACPAPGSLSSLVQRHQAARLQTEGTGRKARTLFTNAPKPRFAAVSYAAVLQLALYDLRERGTDRPWSWALHRAVSLVEQVRDAAAARLRAALPDAAEAIDRCLVGRATDGSGSVPLDQRVRILPLPSIGSVHADRAIRRVLLQIPTGCPLSTRDIQWAFSGLDRIDPETGELSAWVLTRADQFDMQAHYTAPSRHWQSVTPLVLPALAARRRIDPSRRQEQAKPAAERQVEEDRAVAAVVQALRHAGVAALTERVRVQREPFTGHGQRAEASAAGSRFAKERLWHVAITFDRAVEGPLAIGDGRFVGLGVLAPAAAAAGFAGDPAEWTGAQSEGVLALQAGPASSLPAEDAIAMARALRRAVMARVSDAAGPSVRELDPFFSGHHPDRAPDTRSPRHLAFHWDRPRRRWLVLAPHRLEHRAARIGERDHLALLGQALQGMTELKAGPAGRHCVQCTSLPADDPVLAPGTVWESVTPYVVTRHRRAASATDALVTDVLAECARCGLPRPQVSVLDLDSAPGRGLGGRLRLRFSTAVAGPVVLGRTSLLGGGLFGASVEA